MSGTVKATRQHIAMATVFSLAFFGPLVLTAFFPDSRFSQIINSNGAAILVLAVFAGCTGWLVASTLFRDKRK